MDADSLSEQVIACAFRVHNELGSGFAEQIYSRALCIELSAAGIPHAAEVVLVVHFRDQVIGEFRADVLVDRRMLVEIKAVNALIPAHAAQLLNYMNAARIGVGLLINFGASVQIKRRVISKYQRKSA